MSDTSLAMQALVNPKTGFYQDKRTCEYVMIAVVDDGTVYERGRCNMYLPEEVVSHWCRKIWRRLIVESGGPE